MTQYNVDHKFSSPYRVQETMRPLTYLPGNLKSLQIQLEKTLSNYYDRFTVAEWIEQHIRPMVKSLEDLIKKSEILTSVKTWPQRPLGFEDLFQKEKRKN